MRCPTGQHGEHHLIWAATMDGGGYWLCVNPGCGMTEEEHTGHHGG